MQIDLYYSKQTKSNLVTAVESSLTAWIRAVTIDYRYKQNVYLSTGVNG